MPSNRLLNTGSIIAIVAAIALVVGAWFYHQQAAQLKVRNAELQQTKQALDQLTQQAREQTATLNDAIKNSEQHQQEQNARSQRMELLANSLNAASSVKVAMAEFYMAYLKWPASNQEAAIPAPESFKSKGITSIAVQPNGKIRLNLVNPQGKQEQLWLNGSVNAATQVLWKCTTADIPDIAQLIPACSYNGK